MIEAILNRLRGTGLIKHFGTLKVLNKEVRINLVWNHIYAIYLGVIIGIVANAWAGLAVAVAYLIGESAGWGKWLGALTTSEVKDEKWLEASYKDTEGLGFPYIHKIANAIEPEKINGELDEKVHQYLQYSTIALMLRGMYWWGLVYGTMVAFGVIGIYTAIIATLVLGVGFPVASWLGKNWGYTGSIGILNFSRGWENQEIFYGLMQGIVFWIVIIL